MLLVLLVVNTMLMCIAKGAGTGVCPAGSIPVADVPIPEVAWPELPATCFGGKAAIATCKGPVLVVLVGTAAAVVAAAAPLGLVPAASARQLPGSDAPTLTFASLAAHSMLQRVPLPCCAGLSHP